MRSAMGRAVDAIRASVPHASYGNPESYHVTLAFLGNTPGNEIASVREALESATADVSRFEIAIGHVTAFPNTSRPRVIALAVSSEGNRLESLAAAIRRELADRGVRFDAKPFRGHVTLARPRVHLRLFRRLRDPTSHAAGERETVDRIVLYSSSLRSRGAVHSVICERELS
jgi:RNA 2',3'-cyclic 3'-phosphodiesterase